MDNKKDPKDKHEALDQELQVELEELRQSRIRAKKFSQKAYVLLIVALAAPLLLTSNPMYWFVSVGLWVAWVAVKRARKDAFKK